MRGQVLGVDSRTGEGLVAGDDGRRYRFTPEDWAQRGEPAMGWLTEGLPPPSLDCRGGVRCESCGIAIYSSCHLCSRCGHGQRACTNNLATISNAAPIFFPHLGLDLYLDTLL